MRFLLLATVLALPFTFGGCAGKVSTQGSGATNAACQCEHPQKYASDKLVAVKRIPPSFNRAAVYAGIYGCVKVGFDIDPEGKPVNITALSSVPSRVFDDNVIAAVKQWRFRSTRDGKPAWTYDVFQQVNFQFAEFEDQRARNRASWLCSLPPPRPVFVKHALPSLDGMAAVAYSPGETIAYLPYQTHEPVAGSAKIRFCVSRDGDIDKARILRSGPDPRYGLLGISVLQSQPFMPFKPDGGAEEACHLTWSIPFVTRQPHTRFAHIQPISRIGVSLLAQEGLSMNPGTKTTFSAPTHVKKADVGFCINAAGRAYKETLLKSSHYPKLDPIALKVVHDFLFFQQHNKKGEPVDSCGWHTIVQFSRAPSPESALEANSEPDAG